MTSALKVEQLRKSYGNTSVLKGISFDVHEGEIFGILGANGAGKSTTLECIEGVKSFDSGNVSIFGRDMTKHKEAQKLIGVQLQSTALQNNMSVQEAMTFFCKWQKIEFRLDLLDTFGLQQQYKKQYGQLSIGQKRRLHLALALCNNPKIVILDEPTAGLDVEGRMELHNEIRKLKENGVTVVLASHDMAEVEMLCDRLAVIVKGEIRFIGSVRDFKMEGNKEKKVKIRTSKNSLSVEQFIHSTVEEQTNGYLVLSTKNLTQSIAEIMLKINANSDEIEDLTVECLSLEERFMEMVYNEEKESQNERISL
ncbi:MAG: ABC transporter ATP-binding protein [Bacilli bacterium]